MKIVRYGVVILQQGQLPRIEGWLMEPEIDDPTEATANQLVAATAVKWALKHLQAAHSRAVMEGLLRQKN